MSAAIAQAECDSGSVLSFKPDDRLLQHELTEIHEWRKTAFAQECERVVVHDHLSPDRFRMENYVAIHGRGANRKRWGLARANGVLYVWRGTDASPVGAFLTLRRALIAVARDAVDASR